MVFIGYFPSYIYLRRCLPSPKCRWNEHFPSYQCFVFKQGCRNTYLRQQSSGSKYGQGRSKLFTSFYLHTSEQYAQYL